MRAWAVPALTVLALVVSGCTAETKVPPETPSPFADCAALTAAPPSAPAAAVRADLPDLELPCFTGGRAVRLNEVRGPAVINVWASWCEPCRTELPVLQQLADRTAGRLHVIGVDVRDSRDAAASFGTDMKVGMPMLFDRDQALIGALGRAAVPTTVFVDAAGRRTVHLLPMTAEDLADLVPRHTGVTP